MSEGNAIVIKECEMSLWAEYSSKEVLKVEVQMEEVVQQGLAFCLLYRYCCCRQVEGRG